MNAILTGATGTIGIALTSYLLKENNKVLAIVRDKAKLDKLFKNNKNLNIVECDLENIENIKVETKNYDVFYHLAWTGTRGEQRDDLKLQDQNVNYTLKALLKAKEFGCDKFIGIGSQAEYGRVNGIIKPNTKTNPETVYGIAKLNAGNITRNIANKIEIKHIWARIFSVYGLYDNKNTMIMSSIIEMIENNKAPKYTKAEQLWDYIYTQDVAKALYLIGINGKNNEIYCIGSGKVKPLHEYINIIKNEINPEITIKFGDIPYSKKQVMYLCADITSLKKDTGFKPEISFEEGIRRTIKWYKENRIR